MCGFEVRILPKIRTADQTFTIWETHRVLWVHSGIYADTKSPATKELTLLSACIRIDLLSLGWLEQGCNIRAIYQISGTQQVLRQAEIRHGPVIFVQIDGSINKSVRISDPGVIG